jgi:hypothetical protein
MQPGKTLASETPQYSAQQSQTKAEPEKAP